MKSNKKLIFNLQRALNSKGYNILYSVNQFWSDNENRPIKMYKIETTQFDEDKQKKKKVKLFETPSQIQIVLFLRDMWYTANGIPLDDSNEYWNDIKQKNNITV